MPISDLTQDEVEAALRDLKQTRELKHLSAPPKGGVYAIYVRTEGLLAPFREGADRMIYIGGTRNLAERQFEQHFASKSTGWSTLRRSLGAILKQQLTLQAIPRAPGTSETNVRNYRFVVDGEARLTNWMCSHLAIGVHASTKHIDLEKYLLVELNPLLNLTKSNPRRGEIRRLRKMCADEAREARHTSKA